MDAAQSASADHGGHGAGRHPAGREVDRRTISTTILELYRDAHARGAWRATHRVAGGRHSRTSRTTTSITIATCTLKRAPRARRWSWARCAPKKIATTGEMKYYNSVLAMDRATPGVGWYDKHHLVPFAEFFPVPGFVRNWLRLMSLPYADFDRGAAHPAPLERQGSASRRASVTKMPTAARSCRRCAAPTMLVNVTNDAWFGHSHRALPASADQPAARHGSRAPDGARRQRRCFRGHRTPRRNRRPRARICSERSARRTCSRASD